jgi:hypothetical protein
MEVLDQRIRVPLPDTISTARRDPRPPIRNDDRIVAPIRSDAAMVSQRISPRI